MSVSALILAAERDARAGRPQALVEYRGRACLEHLVEALKNSISVEEIVVVTGSDSEWVEDHCRRLGLRPVHDVAFRRGPGSSLRAGLPALSPSSEAALILPVAYPMVRAETIRDMVQAAGADPRFRLTRAFYQGEAGILRLIGREHFERLRRPDFGARRPEPREFQRFDVEDPGVLFDVNGSRAASPG